MAVSGFFICILGSHETMTNTSLAHVDKTGTLARNAMNVGAGPPHGVRL